MYKSSYFQLESVAYYVSKMVHINMVKRLNGYSVFWLWAQCWQWSGETPLLCGESIRTGCLSHSFMKQVEQKAWRMGCVAYGRLPWKQQDRWFKLTRYGLKVEIVFTAGTQRNLEWISEPSRFLTYLEPPSIKVDWSCHKWVIMSLP